MGKARDFKFSTRIHRLAYKPENAKVGQNGACHSLYISATDKVIHSKFSATARGSHRLKFAPLNASTPISLPAPGVSKDRIVP